MEKFVLALDQGTTSSRAIVLDHSGTIISQAQKEFEQLFPKPGWVEHNPEAIWKSQLAVARSALRKARIEAKQIAGIGITNQRETTIVWDRRTGEPLHNAIVWQDRRTSYHCEKLGKSKHAEMIQQKTGLIVDPYFSGTKLAWLIATVPGAKALAKSGQLAFGTVDSWLIWKLTGGSDRAIHKTDFTNASRTLLCRIDTGQWDPELLSALEIPDSVLPEILTSSEMFCETDKKWFGASIPISGVAGDQHAALFGQMCIEPGMVKNTYGTGCFMLMHTGKKPKPSTNRLLTTAAWKIGKQAEYALEGSIFVAGAVVQWLRDGLKIIKRSEDVESLARQVDDNGGVYLVPAFAGLGAPHWDSYARGSIAGLTRGATGAHLARAALESIAYQTADVLDAMQSDAKIKVKTLRVDGGAARNDLLMQFQADILQVPVVRPNAFESTALGAGYLAGLGVGFWKDRQELQARWSVERTFEPQMKKRDVDGLRAGWQNALQRSLDWAK